jgi:3,4-dihydroxy 2-butanone 4-phosphate synthase/GTP cyclohydrolase II
MNQTGQTSLIANLDAPLVQNLVRTRIPTRHGEFWLHYYNNALEEKEHLAIVRGRVDGVRDVAVRLHSECLTGDVFGSLRCDCGDQLDRALRLIGQEECGVLLYLRQEGRGIGLLKKLQAYNLQDEGLDTVEANIRLGHLSDERDYRIAAAILHDLKIASVRLITNNPAKIDELRKLGVDVSNRIPIEIPFNAENEGYLRTKARKMQHMLSLKVRQSPNGEFAFIDPLLRQIDEHLSGEHESPFVTVAYAQSLDGEVWPTATAEDFCSERSRRLTGYLEARHDALLSFPEEHLSLPRADIRRVVLDESLRDLAWLDGLGEKAASLIVLTSPQAPAAALGELRSRSVEVEILPTDAEDRIEPALVLRHLSQRGIRSLIAEARLGREFVRRRLARYAVVTLVPSFSGRVAVEPEPDLLPASFSQCHYHALDRDMVIHGSLAGW